MQLGVLFGSQLLGGFGMKLAVLGASVAGSLLLNGKKEPVGKLNDLRVSSSSYGRGIPIVHGTMRCTGNMIWATEFEEEKSYVTQKGKRKNGSLGKKKSKKGKATETYEYFANFAMGLCAGPVDSLLRVWADNNLIYDKLNPDNEDLVQVGFTRNDDEGGGKRAMKSPARKKGHEGDSGRFAFRFYGGGEDQLPDSFIVGKQGENAVAFRGLSYLFFEKFALADFGNRIPTITAEVATKSQRRPIVRVFENMEPVDFFTTGGGNPMRGQEVFDPIRKRLYHLASKQEDGQEVMYVRVFSFDTFKEIKRIPISPPSKVPQLPQTYFNTEFGTTVEITDFGDFCGVSSQGDFIFRAPVGNNHSPLYWVDPQSMTVKKIWGTASNLGSDEPYGSLGRVQYASPMVMNGSDIKATAKVVTMVKTIFSDIAFFDENYTESNAPRIFNTMGGMNGVKFINPGAHGTDNACVVVGNPIYNLTGTIWTSPIDEPAFLDTAAGLASGIKISPQKLFFRFPTLEQDPNDEVWISSIEFASYCAGARAIVAIGRVLSGSADFPNGVYALKIDPMTKELLWCQHLPEVREPDPLQIPTYLGGNRYSWLYPSGGTSNYVTVDFRQETFDVIPFTPSVIPYPNRSGTYYYADLESLLYMTDQAIPGQANWILAAIDRKVQVPTSVSDVCADTATRVGIPADRLSFSDLSTDEEITGYMIENPTPARQVLEELANIFMFDVIESDNMLKFRTRGGESVVTIPQADLGIVETDFGGDNEYYAETRMQEVELPERVNLSFIDPAEDYETGTQHYKRPLKPLSVMNSREVLEVTVNMALTPKRAKTLAQRILFAAWGERTSHQYTLPRDYLMYEPSDVITIELENGERFTDRITDSEIGSDLSIRLNTVSHIAGSYTLETVVGTPGGVIKIPKPVSPTVKAGVLDIPYLSDDDVDDQGNVVYYWGALAYADGFRFGGLMSELPGNDSEVEGYTNYDAIWGSVQGVVPAPISPPELTDFDTKITLVPAFDFNETSVTYVWESIPDDEWPSEKNTVVIGNEVIHFKEVEILDSGSVVISTLIRGAKGTGENAYTHKGAEDWVLILPNTVQTAEEYFDNLNQYSYFTIQSQSILPPAATRVTKKMTGASRKPWQVGRVKRVNNVGGTVSLSWSRATRYGGALKNGSGVVPLNEETEQYEVFVLKAPYNPATWDPENDDLYSIHKEDVSTPTVTLTLEDLTNAGLTSEMDLHVVIYQLSATVGRGFARGLTLPYTKIAL